MAGQIIRASHVFPAKPRALGRIRPRESRAAGMCLNAAEVGDTGELGCPPPPLTQSYHPRQFASSAKISSVQSRYDFASLLLVELCEMAGFGFFSSEVTGCLLTRGS